ncbi:unnamed protein product [Pseudo-nitzschia multistriata]|uniref:WW domain-containing protein n=1 Tax=Pseudo-nitzschia multistriata TaxID=183589 RepID=A0A448ZN40_9STRA|nr:unnamed protein product [Pseudo-nitzschia multistriata]
MGDREDKLPLPKGWIRTFSNSQKRYYYSHSETKHTQWHFPTASEANDPWMAKRRAETNRSSQQQQPAKKKQRTEKGAAVASLSDVDALLDVADTTSVAIIVPFRDLHKEQKRSEHLSKFIPHMIRFLGNLKTTERRISDYHVYIVEQSDDGRKFNRGKLLNIGFDIARKHKGRNGQKHDVFIFHDVDLLPSKQLNEAYSKFPTVPHHIARCWDRYSNNPKYFGGIVSFSSSDYKRINGYPNTFWGWGGEDDELQLRCNALGIKWDFPRLSSSASSSSTPPITDLEGMTLKEKLKFLKSHREWKCMVKWEALEEHEKNWKTNGLADLQYKVLKTTPLDSKDASKAKATKITVDVKLNPNNHWANDKCGVEYMG